MGTTSLNGTYLVKLVDGTKHQATLPGTLDENRIGSPDTAGNSWHPADGLSDDYANTQELYSKDLIKTRFTRNYTYEGAATFSRSFSYTPTPDKRVFLDIERAREITSCKLNFEEAPCVLQGTLSTPYCFELTNLIKEENLIEITTDNSYPGWPKKEIIYSSAATDETQTNWNGILGTLQLREEDSCFISHVRIYPHYEALHIIVTIDVADEIFDGILILNSEAISDDELQKNINLTKGIHELSFHDIKLKENLQHWDEYEGNLYTLTASLSENSSVTVSFGIRDFSGSTGYLTNNGHRIFLRSESNCCVFPETGHMPFTCEEWLSIMKLYRSYGVNCVRFHSHCPPEAAFAAADALGMFVQPELSHWNPKDAFLTQKSQTYYESEIKQILYCYANHPSFVMLSFGNELHTDEAGINKMTELLKLAKSMDSTRLYAEASNGWYGQKGPLADSDFYTSSNFFEKDLRGTNCDMRGYINHKYPDSKTNYADSMTELRKSYDRPVFSFEVGQFEILPDFDELSEFKGITKPNNLENILLEMRQAGFEKKWREYVEVTGELALLSYREEIEAVMRTEEMSGISLLGLQDFPGQGTALVGMLNSHLKPKPYDFAKPERFRRFFSNVLPLVYLDKYTYFAEESLHAEVHLANYSRNSIVETGHYELWNGDSLYTSGSLSPLPVTCPCGQLTNIGSLAVDFHRLSKNTRFLLKVSFGTYYNEYSIWVYEKKSIAVPDDICVTTDASEAKRLLLHGKKVYFEPNFETALDGGLSELLETEGFGSISTCFTTDFWSVGTFSSQDGYMGCLIDTTHPIFTDFPTNKYPEWQWWILTQARAMILPASLSPLLEVLDCYARLRKLAFLFEKQVGSGKLLVSSLGLLQKQEYPEAVALLKGIYDYMAGKEF